MLLPKQQRIEATQVFRETATCAFSYEQHQRNQDG